MDVTVVDALIEVFNRGLVVFIVGAIFGWHRCKQGDILRNVIENGKQGEVLRVVRIDSFIIRLDISDIKVVLIRETGQDKQEQPFSNMVFSCKDGVYYDSTSLVR